MGSGADVHYTKVERVTRRCGTVRMLRQAVDMNGGSHTAKADIVGQAYRLLDSGFEAQPAFRDVDIRREAESSGRRLSSIGRGQGGIE